MPVQGPIPPSDEEVEEVLKEILQYLKDQHNCLTIPEDFISVRKELREERIDSLRKAIYGMLELESWESW